MKERDHILLKSGCYYSGVVKDDLSKGLAFGERLKRREKNILEGKKSKGKFSGG